MNWVRQDKENRQNHLPLLMEHVRLSLTSREYLLEKVNEEPLLRTDLQCS
jgi:kelch-like protein 2/3